MTGTTRLGRTIDTTSRRTSTPCTCVSGSLTRARTGSAGECAFPNTAMLCKPVMSAARTAAVRTPAQNESRCHALTA